MTRRGLLEQLEGEEGELDIRCAHPRIAAGDCRICPDCGDWVEKAGA